MTLCDRFIDDYWCDANGLCPLRSGNRLIGPAETERHVLLDLNMSDKEVNTMAAAWRANLDAVYDAILAKNATTWDLSFSNSYNVPNANAMTVPRPTVITHETCAAVLAKECSSDGQVAEPAEREDDTLALAAPCCCSTAACPLACPAHCPRFRDIP